VAAGAPASVGISGAVSVGAAAGGGVPPQAATTIMSGRKYSSLILFIFQYLLERTWSNAELARYLPITWPNKPQEGQLPSGRNMAKPAWGSSPQ
jgi:hypothetical protein